MRTDGKGYAIGLYVEKGKCIILLIESTAIGGGLEPSGYATASPLRKTKGGLKPAEPYASYAPVAYTCAHMQIVNLNLA